MCLYKKEDIMSKRFQKVLTNMFPVSFLETIEIDARTPKRIEVQVHSDDERLRNDARVRINHEGEYTDYTIDLHERGEGTLVVDELDASMISLQLIDAAGTPVESDDGRVVRYFVNQEEQECCANVWLRDGADTYVISIEVKRIRTVQLHLEKKIRMRTQERMPEANECFDIQVCGHTTECVVSLTQENQFHEVIQVPCGVYTITELNELCDVEYQLDGKVQHDCVMELNREEHHVTIINQLDADTSVTIEKVMRNGNGEFLYPSPCDRFVIQVISQHRQMEVVLEESNEFCVVLRGLCPGFYSFEELDGPYRSCFVVDDGCESSYAHVEITPSCDHHILVINTIEECQTQQESQLRICKFLRTKDGCLIRPREKQNFQVTIEGCGMCQTMNLNEGNNFCVDIAALCSGCYEIYETPCDEYATSYCINDEMERTSASIFVRDHQSYCVNVINSQKHAGSLIVSKYVRNEYGDLVKPNRQECFDVTLSSYFCKRNFTLSADNDWSMCFADLRLGTYEIRECEQEGYVVEYQVDGKRPGHHARFVMDGCDREVRVINVPYRETNGTLRISKFEETACGELVKPAKDECFHVMVMSECFCETYTLKASNHWCIVLEGLCPDCYRIIEQEEEAFDACYVVNGTRTSTAEIELGCENQEVVILNHRRRSGTLQLHAIIEDCNGQQSTPQSGVTMDVLIEGKDHCYHACLSKDNDWCVLLDELPNDTYRIIQKDSLGFSISYDVDGCIKDFAKIAMNNEDHSVTLINSFTNCAGIVQVCKSIEKQDGTLVLPCPDESFEFELKGRDFCNTYTLCKQNDFCVYFDDLNEGCYEIKEVDQGCDVFYRINQQALPHAKFTLSNEDVMVEIINREVAQNRVVIEKRVRKDGNLCMPCEEDCFAVAVSGRNFYEVYELHAKNDFCILLEGLENQHYEVKELSNCRKTYCVDGQVQKDGYFLNDGCGKEILIINEEETKGALRLEKLIEDACGTLTHPQRWECFEILVESDVYKRKVTLDASNSFCECLFDLPCGHYEIKELCPQGCVSYLIQGMPCESAIVDIVDQDVSVTVINKQGPFGCLQFQGLIEKDGIVMQSDPLDEFVLSISCEETVYELVLHAGNDYCASLQNLKPGSYLVSESGKEDLVFSIEDQRFDDHVCIELNGECVEVCVIKVKRKSPSITIHKWMMDQKKDYERPNCKETFMMCLSHHGKKQMFELNEENDFTKTIMNPKPGMYEVKEEGGNARYQINQGTPQMHGKFEFCEESIVVDVLNSKEKKGTLCLSALVQECDETLMHPDKVACYHLQIEGDVCKSVVLSCENSFKERVELPYGTYRIQCDEEHYFFIDHQQGKHGTIALHQSTMMVQIVFVKPCHTGSLVLQKYVRSLDCDCFKRPTQAEDYEIEIRGENYYRVVYLQEESQYQACIDELANGCYEIKEVGHHHVSYIVDGGMEEKRANVMICDDCHTIKIINEIEPSKLGSIELCKLIKDEEGCYRYPDPTDQYWIAIKGEQGTSRVLLNEANHFYASVRNLREGWYEVIEEEEHPDVRYVVNNGAPMKKGIVHVMNNSNTVNVINTMPAKMGSIQLCKWNLVNQRYVKPEQGEYQVYVSKPEFQTVVTLNKANNYCETLLDLQPGMYVVNELNAAGKVTYIVDDGSENDRAIVDVNASAHTVQVINHVVQEKGSITATKYRRIEDTYRRPESGESFTFYLTTVGYQKTFVLDQSNDWTLRIQDLEPGTYVLTELDAKDRVTYVVDSQSEVDRAIIEVKQDAHDVVIINTAYTRKGSIKVDKFIRENNTLIKPGIDDRYELHVSKPGFNEVYTLDASNEFQVLIENLEDGLYVLDELGEGSVSYIVNGSSETINGIVEVSGNANQVVMINMQPVTTGSIFFRKFIKAADGSLSIPADGDEYTIEVYNTSFLKRVNLNARNRFQSTLSDLKEGTYYLRELEAGEFRVTYKIDGGAETKDGIVEVQKDVQRKVDVINERLENINTIEVFKYMLDKDGNYLPPSAPDTYTFMVSGENIERTYLLEVANDWRVTITDLPTGTYRIKEITQDPATVRYLINSAVLQEEAVFLAVPERTNVIGIINLLPGVQNGRMTLNKRMRTSQGELIIPANGESFVIQVTGENYDRLVALDPSNRYQYTLTNLAYGNYLIAERDASYVVTFQVNGGEENTIGSVNVVNDEDNEVLVINTMVPQSVSAKAQTPASNQSIKVILE